MASKQQLGGMRGLYLVAAELSRLGFVVSPTSRSAQGADLLVTDTECQRAYSVQVKSNSKTFAFWLMGEKNLRMRSPSLMYVLVNLRKDSTEFFVVPSSVVADGIRVTHRKSRKKQTTDTVGDAVASAVGEKTSTWYEFPYEKAAPYEGKWHLFNGG